MRKLSAMRRQRMADSIPGRSSSWFSGAETKGGFAPAAFMSLAMTLSWLDRSLPNVFLENIRHEIELTDSQLGLLTGTAFALCYAIGVVPAGWMADRWHRPRLLASGMAVWSLLTMAVAFAHTFPQLFVCRMGVGLGEAILLPTSYSLLSDLYTSNKRTRAVAIMALGVPIGSGMALLGGSRLAAWLENSGVAAAIDMAPWRLVFALIGVVGLIVAATALFLPEPKRSANVASQESPIPEHLFLSVLWRSRWTLGPLVAAATAFNMAAAGFLAWMVALLVRNNGLETATVGSVLGLSTIAIGLAAAPLAAFWTGRVGSDARRGAPRTVLALCAILAGLGVVATSFAGNPVTGFFAAATALLFIFIATTVLPLAIMDSAEPAYLAKSSAVLVFFASVFGTALGPLAVGSLSDFVFGGGQGLRYAVGMGCGVLLCIAALLFNVEKSK